MYEILIFILPRYSWIKSVSDQSTLIDIYEITKTSTSITTAHQTFFPVTPFLFSADRQSAAHINSGAIGHPFTRCIKGWIVIPAVLALGIDVVAGADLGEDLGLIIDYVVAAGRKHQVVNLAVATGLFLRGSSLERHSVGVGSAALSVKFFIIVMFQSTHFVE